VPAPSHADAGVNAVEPAGQVASPQGAPWAYFWQAPASHIPFVPHVPGACTAQVPDGSGAPVATFVHWPMALGSAHDLQAPVQAVAQQTPCAQTPEMHSVSSEQKAPLPFFPHELCALHVLGAAQSAFEPQVVKQRAPLQPKGAHGSDVAGAHWPVLLHVDAGV
jgi:hypothetical protein